MFHFCQFYFEYLIQKKTKCDIYIYKNRCGEIDKVHNSVRRYPNYDHLQLQVRFFPWQLNAHAKSVYKKSIVTGWKGSVPG